MSKRLLNFMKTFEDLFYVFNRDVTPTARHYLNGLLQSGNRKNMEHMAEIVPNSNHQALHHFISNSNWNHNEVTNRVALNVSELFKDDPDTCYIIDESTFTKKGKFSAGVARQYLGSVGKIDNGQVGVFGSLCSKDKVSIIGAKLYLPKEWTNDTLGVKMQKFQRNKILKLKTNLHMI
jgi:SRSO17 transposase